ncbi:alpha-amylase [Ceratobasidium sp. AG-Ba]|nr:alpha-amylase [Ceratobasidium sp. AG-Ba]QRW07283.1 alpha-amylase [Ceratobasidium sp. AG-Ba]
MRPFGYLSVATATLVSHVAADSFAQHPMSTPPTHKRVIAQMFEWTWDSVAAECTNFLGPAGYGYVQVSPPAEHVTGPEWWTDYQPVSYTLTSKRGNRSQFENMVSTCNAAGVGVIADTILNHMAGGDSGVGVGGSFLAHYNYPGIYQVQDFHHCGLQQEDDIVNYSDRREVQTCELVNLADLATDTEYVQSRLAAYANDLISLGVTGLRLDASKHIASADISNILSRLTKPVYITQEVIYGDGEQVSPTEYASNGDVQEFRYTVALKNAFRWDGISNLRGLENFGWISSSGANVFVANHDTERDDHASLSYKSPSNTYTLAMVFSLAYPYGTPTILSSYAFPDSVEGKKLGAPNHGVGTCSDFCGTRGWLCQHRWSAVAGMVPWFNAVDGAGLNDWQTGSNQQIAFSRGSIGFVAINNEDRTWSNTFKTSLPDGSYCDVISGPPIAGACSGASFKVSNGFFSANVPARGAIAIYTGAMGSSSSSSQLVVVTFTEVADTIIGENIFVLGSISELGSWVPENAIPMSPEAYPTWAAELSIPAGVTFEYKYIKKTPSGEVTWESGPNRIYTVPLGGAVSSCDAWR